NAGAVGAGNVPGAGSLSAPTRGSTAAANCSSGGKRSRRITSRSYSSPPPSWCSGLWDRLLGIPCEEDAEPAPAVALSAARDPTVDGVGHEDRVDGVEPVDQRDRLRLALVV